MGHSLSGYRRLATNKRGWLLIWTDNEGTEREKRFTYYSDAARSALNLDTWDYRIDPR